MATPCLEARGLIVRQGSTDVLRGLDLEVSVGQVLAIVGPTGAGKTTLFRALVGELTPRSGRVLLEGSDLHGAPLWERARRGLGYLPQTPSVLVDLTVRQNLATFESLAPSAARPPLGSEAWAREVELHERLDVRAGALSGGERRRLELARALIARPRVLICDEPFAGLDPAGAARVAELLRARAAAGLAIVLTDHHAPEALRICQRAAFLLDGVLAVRGLPEELRAHPLVARQYLAPPRSSGG